MPKYIKDPSTARMDQNNIAISVAIIIMLNLLRISTVLFLNLGRLHQVFSTPSISDAVGKDPHFKGLTPSISKFDCVTFVLQNLSVMALIGE